MMQIPERKLGYRFMLAEAWWILTGQNKLTSIDKYSKHIKEFSDDGTFFMGAYGPKVVDQLPYVLDCLVSDPSTRQAVISIWRERPRPSKDIPCTLSLQFLIRDSRLNCIATMRSSDIWLGWPYDVFNFSMISKYICELLHQKGFPVYLGDLYFTAGSQHLYEQNFEAANKIVEFYTKYEDKMVWDESKFVQQPIDGVCGIIEHLDTLKDFSLNETYFENALTELMYNVHAPR